MNERKRLWGGNIRRARLALNASGELRRSDEDPMSQERLGELVGVTQQTVSDWERGLATPSDDHKVRVCEVLHQDVRQVFPLVRAA